MEKNEYDMTGMSLEKNKDWEIRVKDLAKPENFKCRIWPEGIVQTDLSLHEWNRLETKLKLVEDFACAMAAGMLKGTIKYPIDTWGKDWARNTMGEGADFINYMLCERYFK